MLLADAVSGHPADPAPFTLGIKIKAFPHATNSVSIPPRRMKYFFILILVGLSLNAFAQDATAPSVTGTSVAPQPLFMLVPGAWGGGWDWKQVDQILTTDGYKVSRATLTGLGERYHLASTNIDLDTHINDLVNHIIWEDLHNVILVGHSYGGMVITGVADRVPDRIKQLIYVDAFVPKDGDSVNTLQTNTTFFVVTNGWAIGKWMAVNPPPPHDVPMSEKCFSQPIHLIHQAALTNIPTTYILTVDKGADPTTDDFYPFYHTALTRGQHVIIMEADHNVQRSNPRELCELIESTQ